MKRLTCEMCGSTDMIKENGVFVCQACGCKYSVEEAKKMMIEGAVDVSQGKVIDGNQQRLDNLRKLADRAKEENDSETAAKYFEQILIEAPDDWEANFYTIYYSAHNIRMGQLGNAANRISNCLTPVCKLISDNVPEEQQKNAYTEVRDRVISFANLAFSNANRHAGSSLETLKQNINDWFVPAVTMLVVLGDNLSSVFGDYDAAETVYSGAKNSSSPLAKWTDEMDKLDKTIAWKIDSIRNLKRQKEAEERANQLKAQREEAQRRIDLYWETHQEQHAALTVEKEALVAQIQEFDLEKQKRIEEIQSGTTGILHDKEIKTLGLEIERMEGELKALGIFKGKEKRALRAQIEEVCQRRDQMEAEDDNVKQQIQSRIDMVEKEAKSKKMPIEIRIKEIDTELTKDR